MGESTPLYSQPHRQQICFWVFGEVWLCLLGRGKLELERRLGWGKEVGVGVGVGVGVDI